MRGFPIVLLLSAAAQATAQAPAIGASGVFQSASRVPSTLPGGGIARGARFTIEGVRLSAGGPPVVTIAVGAEAVAARVIRASATEVERGCLGMRPLAALD